MTILRMFIIYLIFLLLTLTLILWSCFDTHFSFFDGLYRALTSLVLIVLFELLRAAWF